MAPLLSLSASLNSSRRARLALAGRRFALDGRRADPALVGREVDLRPFPSGSNCAANIRGRLLNTSPVLRPPPHGLDRCSNSCNDKFELVRPVSSIGGFAWGVTVDMCSDAHASMALGTGSVAISPQIGTKLSATSMGGTIAMTAQQQWTWNTTVNRVATTALSLA